MTRIRYCLTGASEPPVRGYGGWVSVPQKRCHEDEYALGLFGNFRSQIFFRAMASYLATVDQA